MISSLVRHTCTVPPPDRKSTRLNSSHGYISYAVFCLKKKNYLFEQIYSNLMLTEARVVSCRMAEILRATVLFSCALERCITPLLCLNPGLGMTASPQR